jgi:hypothetical protein
MTEQVKFTKSNRAGESREKTARRKPWAPPSRLDAPPPPDGFKYRWIRAETQGFEDKQNVFSKIREGYELVRLEELPEEYQHSMPAVDEGKNKGVVGVGGLLLAKIPVETIQEREAYFRNRTREQLAAVDNDMLKANAHGSMRINKAERSSRVSFGGPRGGNTDES